MAAQPPPAPPAVIEVYPSADLWRMRSDDNLFFGVFRDCRSAVRHAAAEAEAHPGHVVLVRDEPAP